MPSLRRKAYTELDRDNWTRSSIDLTTSLNSLTFVHNAIFDYGQVVILICFLYTETIFLR